MVARVSEVIQSSSMQRMDRYIFFEILTEITVDLKSSVLYLVLDQGISFFFLCYQSF